MSYERNGLGWSDIPITTGWLFKETTYPECGEIQPRGIKKCFVMDHPDDVRCAQYSGCINLDEDCETVSGRSGKAHCCPPDKPPPPPAECIPPGTRPGVTAQGLLCRFQHVPFNSLGNDVRARATWTIQNKLCQIGIDPGPVDGTENNDRYRQAIREFQARRGLPVTGETDAVTLRAMGLENAQSISSSLLPDVIGDSGMPNILPFVMVGAFGLSGIFLTFALMKFKRSRR